MAGKPTPRGILLVDDHPLLLEGLERLINAGPGIRVCGMAGDVQQALKMVESGKPDLIVTDLTLPGRNGLELIKDLAATHPEIPIIVLSMHDEMIYAERVLRAGGRGYVMKDTPPECLLEAIRAVLGGGVFASQAVTSHLLRSLSGGKANANPDFRSNASPTAKWRFSISSATPKATRRSPPCLASARAPWTPIAPTSARNSASPMAAN